MSDRDLEQRLVDHYRLHDPGAAPEGLHARIEQGLDRRSMPGVISAHAPAFAAAIAAVLLAAVVVGPRLGGLLTSSGTDATPSAVTPTPTASPSPSSGSTVPPVSTTPWTTLDVQLTRGEGPDAVTSLVSWAGGALAIGNVASDAGPVPAWTSIDGRSWTALPTGTLGTASAAVGAPFPGGIVVLTVAADGTTTAWRSVDGQHWQSAAAPRLDRADVGSLAGSAKGLVMVAAGQSGLAYSADGVTWQPVTLPGAQSVPSAVTAFGSGFVVVGSGGLAWWSADGLHWTAATVPPQPGSFQGVAAARGGLVAISLSGGVPGTATFWTSADGHTWAPSDADPLGTWPQGEGAGSANGLFTGDGTRLLGYGIRADGQPQEYWTSLDGIAWTRLVLAGDTAGLGAVQPTPFLLRNGLLLATDTQAWFAAAP